MAERTDSPEPEPRSASALERLSAHQGPIEHTLDRLHQQAPSPGEFLQALYEHASHDPAGAATVLRGEFAHHPNPHHWAHDLQVITAFVHSYAMSTTRRRYLLELQRLLLWALVERGKPPSGLTLDDAAAYAQFLAQPVDASRAHQHLDWWHGPGVRRFTDNGEQRRPNPLWRPFADRPMSEKSRQHCLTVLEGFFNYAVDEGYLAINAFRRRGRHSLAGADNQRGADRAIGFGDLDVGAAPRRAPATLLASSAVPAGDAASVADEAAAPQGETSAEAQPSTPSASVEAVERFLPLATWQWLCAYLEALPRESPEDLARFHQWRFCVLGMYATAARIHEWANHSMTSFRWGADGRLFWYVTGKGRSAATGIPVLPWFGPILQETRAYLGLPPAARPGEQVPLAFSLEPGIGESDAAGQPVRQGISVRHLRARIEKLFRLAAAASAEGAIAERLVRATPHWLRHTVITHLLNDADNPRNPRDVMQFARHKNINTTLLYLHTEKHEHHDHIVGRLARGRVDWGV